MLNHRCRQYIADIFCMVGQAVGELEYIGCLVVYKPYLSGNGEVIVKDDANPKFIFPPV